ncbi:unnamed protein product [Ectocarpus sp. 12 AP-2014]
MPASLDKQLLVEVLKGNERGVEEQLDLGASLDGFDTRKPLFVAARHGRAGVVTLLAKRGAELEATCPRDVRDDRGMYVYSSGSRAVHAAVYAGRVDSLRALLDAGADPNAADATGHTPLMQACRLFGAADRYVVVRELLRGGADPARQSNDGMIALHYASFRDDTDVIRLLLPKAMATINQDTGYGGTPLCCAASGGYEESVRCLLSFGASDNALWSKKGASALVGAVQEGRQEIVRILVDHGVDAVGGLDAVPKAIWTATRKGHAKILHMLLAVAGEETRRQWATMPFNESTLLHCATSVGSLSVTSVILSAGADETARDQYGDFAKDVICARFQVNPATRAAIFRTLLQGPAYRARSWAWPTMAGTDDDGDDDIDGSGLSSAEGARKDKDWPVGRVARPRNNTFFISGFAR